MSDPMSALRHFPTWLFLVGLGFSLLSFAAYWRDKRAARRNARRTPERTLHLLALLGGWPGAWLAQRLLRHKSAKRGFQVVFRVTVAANLLICALLFFRVG